MKLIDSLDQLTEGTLILDTKTKHLYKVKYMEEETFGGYFGTQKYIQLDVTRLSNNKDYKFVATYDDELLGMLSDYVILPNDELIIKVLYG